MNTETPEQRLERILKEDEEIQRKRKEEEFKDFLTQYNTFVENLIQFVKSSDIDDRVKGVFETSFKKLQEEKKYDISKDFIREVNYLTRIYNSRKIKNIKEFSEKLIEKINEEHSKMNYF